MHVYRWLEYSMSASIMISARCTHHCNASSMHTCSHICARVQLGVVATVAIAVLSGVAHVYQIVFIFVLMKCTQIFGYYTELLSRPESLGPDIKPIRWEIRDDTPELLAIPELPAVVQRLWSHLLGYSPYIAIWVVLLHSFFFNVSIAGDGQRAPDFVYAIVIGQFVVFTGFGVTQLVNQIDERGPSWYMWGEWSYLLLSILAKGLLGITLIANVFAFNTLDDALANANER